MAEDVAVGPFGETPKTGEGAGKPVEPKCGCESEDEDVYMVNEGRRVGKSSSGSTGCGGDRAARVG